VLGVKPAFEDVKPAFEDVKPAFEDVNAGRFLAFRFALVEDQIEPSTKTHEDCPMLNPGSDQKERAVLSRVGERAG